MMMNLRNLLLITFIALCSGAFVPTVPKNAITDTVPRRYNQDVVGARASPSTLFATMSAPQPNNNDIIDTNNLQKDNNHAAAIVGAFIVALLIATWQPLPLNVVMNGGYTMNHAHIILPPPALHSTSQFIIG